MKYWIYRNLRTKTWSLKQNNKVVAHPLCVICEDVEFRVWQGTVAKIRKDKRKSVGAFVISEKIAFDTIPWYDNLDLSGYHEVTFNPYKYDSFVIKATEEPIFTAERCVMTPDMKVWVNGKID
jgi:hypothetical protein